MTAKKPLNGTKTHPLSDHARDCLRALQRAPKPTQEFNAGVVDRLLRGEFAEVVMLPSPYAAHKGKPLNHLSITQTGRAEIPRIVDETR